MAVQKFIPSLSCRVFPQANYRLARIAQALSRAAYPHPHDESLKSHQATAETACRQLAAHARQRGAA